MNPYGDECLGTRPHDGRAAGSLQSAPPYSPSDPHEDPHHPPLSATSQSPPLIHTGHSYLTVVSGNPPLYQASSDPDGGENLSSSAGTPTSPLPGANQSHSLPVASDHPVNPYAATPPSCQVSVIVPSPDLCPSPDPCPSPQCSDSASPDLECAICFSEFNNVFRCPKMLQCKHTFCLECLARMNVKSAQPNTIQCPLCRGLTPLPTLGLPKLTTDSDVLSYLPAAMQRVYSIRFQRNKGKLQVKRSSQNRNRSLMTLRPRNHSLDVGLPSPPTQGNSVSRSFFTLTSQPLCRAFLLTCLVMVIAMLVGIIIYLLTGDKINKQQ